MIPLPIRLQEQQKDTTETKTTINHLCQYYHAWLQIHLKKKPYTKTHKQIITIYKIIYKGRHLNGDNNQQSTTTGHITGNPRLEWCNVPDQCFDGPVADYYQPFVGWYQPVEGCCQEIGETACQVLVVWPAEGKK